jgi:hypothetical protein
VKTLEELQTAIDEIHGVCKKHGIVLVGTCDAEGIYGEISICENTSAATFLDNISTRLSNKVIMEDNPYAVAPSGSKTYNLSGIGTLKS